MTWSTCWRTLGFLLRGEIVWQKSHAAGGSCAWGTYQRPGNPVLRDVSERIVVASKGRFDRAVPAEDRERAGLPREGTMTMDEFVDATTDVWDLPAESATRVGHPAPFPVELPRRLIELYTYRGDLVLDPFMGSGSTAVAAVRTGRHYAGFDTDPAYVDLTGRRVAEERARSVTGPRVTVAPGRQPASRPRRRRGGPRTQGPRHRRRGAGHGRVHLGRARGGVPRPRRVRRLPGTRRRGATWLFLLCGAYSATRPGLRRPEVLWRALGVAAVLHEARAADPDRHDLGPLVLLSTDLPPERSAGDRALRAVASVDGPVRAVCELLDGATGTRLAVCAGGVGA